MITAQVVLINEEGLILGVSRKTDHNDFGLAGGKMDPEDNGDPMATAIRECKEETGLDVTDLELVFAIHKYGNLSYTYLAKYSGEINHDEPHVVKWVPLERLVNGSFGKYNKMVGESLDSMGVKYQKSIDIDAMATDVEEFVKKYFDGKIEFGCISDRSPYGYEVYFNEGPDDDFDEAFDAPPKFAQGLKEIGLKYGVHLHLTSDYTSK